MRYTTAAAAALFLVACASPVVQSYEEATVTDLQTAMQNGELTARRLTDYYLQRIERIDHSGANLRSVIEINPDAQRIADALDDERRDGKVRGPLHGIPIVLKANIDTGDTMTTSAGSLALADHRAADDAFLVQQLRDAGAIILAKTNLSEWANFRSTNSSSGWSSLGGQTGNAYDPRRNPCGSSSGSAVAVAANLSVLAIGTETDGSVVCPASINGIVGIKPTLGLISRDGIIPIAHSQDTAGPMARTVRDAAVLLNALVAKDNGDPASADRPASLPDYASDLRTDALQGKRIGVLRNYGGAGKNDAVEEVFTASIALLQSLGADIVDPVDIDTDGMGDAEFEVLLYEFKADLNKYFAESNTPVSSLSELIAFNDAHSADVMPIFGQELLIMADAKGPLTEAAYLNALADSKSISRDGINDAFEEHQLDALIAPSNGPAWLTDHINGDTFSVGSSSLAAVSGYASITVPAGQVQGLPVGLSFIGGAYSEGELIRLAYAFEQGSAARRAPDPENPHRP
ncbi:MAG: amidase [Woeseia sp.]